MNLDLRKNAIRGNVGLRTFDLGRDGDRYIGSVSIVGPSSPRRRSTAPTTCGRCRRRRRRSSCRRCSPATATSSRATSAAPSSSASAGARPGKASTSRRIYHAQTGDVQRAIMQGIAELDGRPLMRAIALALLLAFCSSSGVARAISTVPPPPVPQLPDEPLPEWHPPPPTTSRHAMFLQMSPQMPEAQRLRQIGLWLSSFGWARCSLGGILYRLGRRHQPGRERSRRRRNRPGSSTPRSRTSATASEDGRPSPASASAASWPSGGFVLYTDRPVADHRRTTRSIRASRCRRSPASSARPRRCAHRRGARASSRYQRTSDTT